MDRSRRQGAKETEPPSASRLTVKPKRNRRRTAGSLWARVPRPAAMADACGRALRRSLPAAAALGVLVAVGGTAWASYRFVTTSPRFAITEVVIHGNRHVAAVDLRSVRVGDNVFATSLDEVVRELRANPWIADAEARRILPHTIAIEVRERTAVAVAELGGLYLVDASGHPFKHASDDEGAGLPVLTGLDRAAYAAAPDAVAAQLQGALAALDDWRGIGDRPAIGEVHLDPHGALVLHASDSPTAIDLGPPGELAARLRAFDAAWAALTAAERTRARTVHLGSDHATIAFAKN